MPKRKRKKNLVSDITGFAGAGMGLGIGAGVASKAGAPAGVMSGFGTAGRMMRPMGMAMMAGYAMGGLRKKRKRKKR